MAAIQVTHGRDRISVYKDAERWVIDPQGRLHIVGGNGNLASFNTDLWQGVEFVAAPAD